jgi:hypothetical protein
MELFCTHYLVYFIDVQNSKFEFHLTIELDPLYVDSIHVFA